MSNSLRNQERPFLSKIDKEILFISCIGKAREMDDIWEEDENVAKECTMGCRSLVGMLSHVGYNCSLKQAGMFWRWHSRRLNSRWLDTSVYDTDRIKEIINNFIEEYKGVEV